MVISKGLVVDSEETLTDMLFYSMYNVPTAMLFARAIRASNENTLAAFDAETIDGESALARLERAMSPSLSPATFKIVNCYDLAKSWTDEGLAEALRDFDDAERAELMAYAEREKAACGVLPAASVDPSRLGAPVGSNAPTLFFAGRLDPVTPIEWATADQARFPRSKMVVSECMSHGVVFYDLACNTSILKSFVENPDAITTMNVAYECVRARCYPDKVDDDLFPR